MQISELANYSIEWVKDRTHNDSTGPLYVMSRLQKLQQVIALSTHRVYRRIEFAGGGRT